MIILKCFKWVNKSLHKRKKIPIFKKENCSQNYSTGEKWSIWQQLQSYYNTTPNSYPKSNSPFNFITTTNTKWLGIIIKPSPPCTIRVPLNWKWFSIKTEVQFFPDSRGKFITYNIVLGMPRVSKYIMLLSCVMFY